MERLLHTLQHWSRGVRLYLSIGILLLTAEIWWWATTVIDSPQLQTVRMQEIYAWFSIGFLALTLLIGPAVKLLPQLLARPQVRESRRIIGIGAAWFAALHATIVYFRQFGGSNPFLLPRLYQQALLLGVIALVAMLLLAATSVNAIMKAWGVWWFRLHRLIYVSALAGLMHAFMIGAHATNLPALIILGIIAAIWVGIQLYFLIRYPTPSVWQIIALSYGTILLAAVLNYGVTQYAGHNIITGNHGSHSEHEH